MKSAKNARSKQWFPKIGTKCEIDNDGEWIPGVIIGYRQGDYRENFKRVDVRTSRLLWEGCSPQCVRVKGKDLIEGPF